MNLVKDPWLPFKLRDGNEQVLPITAICDPEVEDFALPRADFQGAAYQFVVGLLQTVFAPQDRYEWGERFIQPPPADELQLALDRAAHAFNVTGDGPLFMQDFDPLNKAKIAPIFSLFLEAPGENTIKENKDHFAKRNSVQSLSISMAVMALFTLQINAPGGGRGNRAGLRGGGPITTLILPHDDKANLWQKIWSNIINRDYWVYNDPDLYSSRLFPWLGETKTSEKSGTEIYQNDVEGDIHVLHMYWATPRRIRLDIEEKECECCISGRLVRESVHTFRYQNYGANYAGTWGHPLTPYSWFPKEPDRDHSPLKGRSGGFSYNIWHTLTFTGESSDGKRAHLQALVVAAYSSLYSSRVLGVDVETPRLWVFGYHLEKMKPRCWYSVMMPLFDIDPEQQEVVLIIVKELQTLANDILWQCKTQLKSAWLEKPNEAKKDYFDFVDLAFWQRTEIVFFETVQAVVVSAVDDAPSLTPQHAECWLNTLRSTATDIFDEFALSELGSERSMAKRIKSRQKLSGWLYAGKQIKKFISDNKIESHKEAV